MANYTGTLQDSNGNNLYPSQMVKTGDFVANITGLTISNECRVKQVGKVVEVHLFLTKSSAFGTSELNLGRLTGVDIVPKALRTMAVTGTNGWSTRNPCYLIFGNTGTVTILANNTTDTVVNIDVVYTVD